MASNHNQPGSNDAVLGGKSQPHSSDVVLGGLEAAKIASASKNVAQRVAALKAAVNYGEAGLELVMQALKDKSRLVRSAAYSLLRHQTEPRVKLALRSYNPYADFECLHTLGGHRERVIFVAITPDNQTLISGSWDKIILRNLNTGEEIRTLINVSGSLTISCVALSADGNTLVCVGGWGIIKVWNLKTQQQRLSFRGHAWGVGYLALSSDGQILVTSSDDQTIKVWNLKKGREIGLVVEPEYSSVPLTVTPDGQTLVYITESTIKVCDWKKRYNIYTFEGHENSVTSVVVSPDGQTVVSGSYDNKIKVWNLATGQEICTLVGHSDGVSTLTISPDGKTLVSGSYDNTIKVWNLATRQEIHTFVEPLDDYYNVESVAISADGRTIVSSDGKTIKVWGMP